MTPDPTAADLPMVDAHVHFWDPTKHYYPWLNDEPMIPFRYGDYSAIRRPYYPAEHLADARSHGACAPGEVIRYFQVCSRLVIGSRTTMAECAPPMPNATMRSVNFRAGSPRAG